MMAGSGQSPCTMKQMADQQDKMSLGSRHHCSRALARTAHSPLTQEENPLPSCLSHCHGPQPGLQLIGGARGRASWDPACPSLSDTRQGCLCVLLSYSLSSFSISTVRLLASTMTRYSGAASTGPITVSVRNIPVGAPCPWLCTRSSLSLDTHPPAMGPACSRFNMQSRYQCFPDPWQGQLALLWPQCPQFRPSQQALPTNSCLGPGLSDLGRLP